MGFFFSQKKIEAKRAGPRKGVRNAPATKQNTQTLNRLGCAACPLNHADVDTPKMKPTVGAKDHIYFLAEAPGQHEDESSGRPLTGPSGKLLREVIPDDEEQYCSFDNVVRDRPEKNRTPVWQEIECCRNHIVKSIEDAKPKLLVGLGVVPLTWTLASTDLSGMRGRLFALRVGTHSLWFIPTYHPSFILRNAYKKDRPLQSRFGHCFKMDIRRAFDLLGTLPPARVDTPNEARAGVRTFDGSQGYPDLIGLLDRASEAPVKAIDLETQGLRPYAADAAILTVAISFDDVNFSFALDHPKAKWGLLEHDALTLRLGKIVADNTKKIAHNVPFELEWLIKEFGKGIVNHHAWECTMMQAHFLDERRGRQGHDDDNRRAAYQGLDFLCRQHFGIPYKQLFKLNKKDMASNDLNEVLTYNAVDTKYTLRLWHTQKALLKEHGLWEAYQEALPRQPSVALMQHLGINIDQAEVKFNQKELEAEIGRLNKDISSLKVIKKFNADKGRPFNPLSNPDTIDVFKNYLHRKEIIVDVKHFLDFDQSSVSKQRVLNDPKARTKFSVDKNVLAKIDHPLAYLIIDYRNCTKNKSTYADAFEFGKGQSIWPDGKIHTSFNTTFAETGRTSSDDPNMQNFPKRQDAWVRRQIIPPKNHVLIAADYGQLEGCTTAMCSRDKVLVKALNEDYDIHMEWCMRLVKAYPQWLASGEDIRDKAVAKKYRSIAKNKLVFPAIFGATTDSIAKYLKIPENIADDLMDEFWGIFTGLKRWQDTTMKTYYETGYVSSPTGRWRRYPLNRNQVINFPVQGVAADIVCDSMNALSMHAAQTGQWHLHPRLNIHDDLTFVVPDSPQIIDDAIRTIYEVMLTPTYDFINVPLSVEVSKGYNWFKMTDVGKFWSNKDV